MQHMHGNKPYMLDCWVNPVVHLLLLYLPRAPCLDGYLERERKTRRETERRQTKEEIIFEGEKGE